MCHSERSEESRSDPLFRDRPRGRARFLASLGMTPFTRVFQHPATTELMGIPLRRACSYLTRRAEWGNCFSASVIPVRAYEPRPRMSTGKVAPEFPFFSFCPEKSIYPSASEFKVQLNLVAGGWRICRDVLCRDVCALSGVATEMPPMGRLMHRPKRVAICFITSRSVLF